MRILYLHGLSSKPGGVKPTFLASRGFDVVNPALPDDDFAESTAIASRCLAESAPEVVVGSSRGGAVALAIAGPETKLVLIAPAWKKWLPRAIAPRHTRILHSAHDAVIAHADSLELLAAAGLPASLLTTVGADHNMIDPQALAALMKAIQDDRTITP